MTAARPSPAEMRDLLRQARADLSPRDGRAPDRTPGGWRWSDVRNPAARPANPPTLTETDNPVVGTILGPDGAPLRQFTQRPRVPFGYQPSGVGVSEHGPHVPPAPGVPRGERS